MDERTKPSYNVIRNALDVLASGEEREVFLRNESTEFSWRPVMNFEAKNYIEFAAKHWRDELLGKGLTSGDIVALWVTGTKFTDLVNIYSVMIAGFIPQLFSSFFKKPEVVWDLFERSGSRAILYDSEFTALVENARKPVTKIEVLQFSDLRCSDSVESNIFPDRCWKDVALIAHSSGTTAQSPKLIPCTYGWFHNFVHNKFPACVLQGEKKAANAMNTFGNLAKIATICLTVAALTNEVKIIQSSSKVLSTEEIVAMIRNHGLNRALYVGSTLSVHLQRAQKTSELFEALKSCDQIVYSGVTLRKDDELWARKMGLPVTSSYGSSETAMVMTSVSGPSPSDMLFRMIPGLSIKLIPYTDYSGLLEMIVKGGEIDSPHSSLLAETGVYHTKDLFSEVEPGHFSYRGRAGDFIKTLDGLCDANVIEDLVRSHCKDIVNEALVLGANRPAPVLFIEIFQNTPNLTVEQIKQRALEALTGYNSRVYKHEEISSISQVVVLKEGDLPRTEDKGNPKRNAAEEMFGQIMDDIFSGQAANN